MNIWVKYIYLYCSKVGGGGGAESEEESSEYSDEENNVDKTHKTNREEWEHDISQVGSGWH